MKKLCVVLGLMTCTGAFAQELADCREQSITAATAAYVYVSTADKNAYKKEFSDMYAKNNMAGAGEDMNRYMQMHDYFESTKALKRTNDKNFNFRQAGYMGKNAWNLCFSKNKVAPTPANKCYAAGLEQEKDPTLSKVLALSKNCAGK